MPQGHRSRGLYASSRTARSTARPPSRSIRSRISTSGPTAPTSSPSRCSSRIITIRPILARQCRRSIVNVTTGLPAYCAGATEIYGLFRSTFGWNEIFSTKAFTMGPLHQHFVRSRRGRQHRKQLPGAGQARLRRRSAVRVRPALQGLLQRGALGVLGILNHNAFNQCGVFGPGGIPGVTCITDGNTEFKPTWAVETNYYMDLGFLPENMQYFSISGRAAWYGTKGDGTIIRCRSASAAFNTATKTEFNSEPIRLTFDASKAIVGREILPLRRRLGRLSLLAEQVRPRPQCRQPASATSPHRREQPTPAPKVTVYAGIT